MVNGDDDESPNKPHDNALTKDPNLAQLNEGGESYYQRSINSILQSVSDCYGNILNDDERRLLTQVNELEKDAQRLFYRLYLRKPGWHRVEKLEYKDISDKNLAISRLVKELFLEDQLREVDDVLNIMHLDELKELAKELKLKSNSLTREQLKSEILTTKFSKQTRLSFSVLPRKTIAEESCDRILEIGRRKIGSVARIPMTIFETLQKIIALFFLDSMIEEDNLSTAILADLNRKKYPLYIISRSRPIFSEREDWVNYGEALNFERATMELLTSEETVITADLINDLVSNTKENWQKYLNNGSKIESYFLRRYSAGWIYTRILSYFTTIFEKLKLFEDANKLLETLLNQDIYCLGNRGKWWERLVLNLASHLGDKAKSLEMIKHALSDVHVRTGSRISLQRRQAKLTGQAFDLDQLPPIITIYADPEDKRATGRKLCYLLPGNVLGSVEELALHHFANDGWIGFHCESGIYRTLFTLIFWDILFDDKPDVFQTPFQVAPLDLKTDAFFETRHERIYSRLEAVMNGQAPQILVDTYYPFYGCQAIGVLWEEYPLCSLLNVCHSLGGHVLSTIFRVFAEDYANNTCGLPDLLLYRADQSDYLLVEVKSTNDKLSDIQKNWNAIFKEHGIKVALCKVLDTSEQDRQPKKRIKSN